MIINFIINYYDFDIIIFFSSFEVITKFSPDKYLITILIIKLNL